MEAIVDERSGSVRGAPVAIDEPAAHSLRDAARAGVDIVASLPALLAASDEDALGPWRDVVVEAIVWHHARRERWAELGEIIQARRCRSTFYYALATIARQGCDVTPAFEHILHPPANLDETQGQMAAVSACADGQPRRVAEILGDRSPALLLEYLGDQLLPRSGLDVTPAFPYLATLLASTDAEIRRKATVVCHLAAEARQPLGPAVEPLERLLVPGLADTDPDTSTDAVAEIRGRAAYALSFQWQTNGEFARVDGLCRHPDAVVRRQATRASYVLLHGGASMPGLVQRIAAATLDEDAELRAAALSCLTKAWQRDIPIDFVLEDPHTPEARELIALVSSDRCRICSSLPRRVTWSHSVDEPEAFSKLEKDEAGQYLVCPRCHALYTHACDFEYVDGARDETWTLERLGR